MLDMCEPLMTHEPYPYESCPGTPRLWAAARGRRGEDAARGRAPRRAPAPVKDPQVVPRPLGAPHARTASGGAETNRRILR
ncbi:hypothetical protein GCM10023336_41160 [Streptomyces similanensis]|uniref:Uncharacterized protein n=1 Tax=Streptomyces similanensis TaxID=1274988 RepID=A0ABP9KSI0_9ACTN